MDNSCGLEARTTTIAPNSATLSKTPKKSGSRSKGCGVGRVELTFGYVSAMKMRSQVVQTYRGIRLHTNTLFFRFPTRAAKNRSCVFEPIALWRLEPSEGGR